MVIGIICEYNPFHNGHLYQIQEIKKMYPNSTLIAIMSGNFVQRGNFSILNKFDKARIAINYGIDLVVELPVFYATQSADVFACGALKLANLIGCDAICFGAEHDDINYFYKNIKISNTDEYNNEVKKLLRQGLNYPTATSQALKTFGGDNIDLPNDILALRYIKEIVNNNYNIKPIIIKRTNNFNDINSNDDIISANNIRNKIKNNIDISKYVPPLTYRLLKDNYIPNINDYYDILKYTIIVNKDRLCEYAEVNKGLANRMIKWIYKSNSLDEFINNIRSKNDTLNKINRVIMHILTNVRSDDVCNIDSIRILGFSNIGRHYLKNIKNNVNIINKFGNLSEQEKNQELLLNYLYYLKDNSLTYQMSNYNIMFQ